MAGANRPSVTGLDDRTLGRIDLVLAEADYVDARAAIDDAWRVAVLAAHPGLRADRDRARAAAVQAANRRRDPRAARVRTSTGLHRALLIVAFLLGAFAVAPIAVPRGRPLALDGGMLTAGVLAVVSVALLWWLEPRRANGSLWGARAPAVIDLFFGGLWLVAAAVAIVVGWGAAGAGGMPVILGLAMLTGAGIAALVLWRHGLRADRSGRQTGLARVTADLVDERDAAGVFDALDRWWEAAGPEAMRTDAARVRDARTEVLARLRGATMISESDEREASAAPVPARWSERRR
ncbi:hypothetical protein AB1K54_17070 [Microbacterium sp. BWT-B31]|uniref:hypothetical protein n=1 Tax=Microbacterium sp. BWT-B31 TaxID=3232072 RepID=UPI0035293320